MTLELQRRIKAFINLGIHLSSGKYLPDYAAIAHQNPWFTRPSVDQALSEIEAWLNKESLLNWIAHYRINTQKPLKVGLIMAGNLPLVGFHDLMVTLLSGNIALIKPSHQDSLLVVDLVTLLIQIEPAFKSSIFIRKSLEAHEIDRLIATGSDNSSRYFEFQFQGVKKVIRGNRTSHAVINGSEKTSNWNLLSRDIFDYYGKGCRSVSKLWLPTNFDVEFLRANLKPGNQQWSSLPSYQHNYQYHKAGYSLQGQTFMDEGDYLLVESHELVSPIGVIFYEFYPDINWLKNTLDSQHQKIQALYSENGWFPGSLSWGQAQAPALNDYADRIDTMKFLLES